MFRVILIGWLALAVGCGTAGSSYESSPSSAPYYGSSDAVTLAQADSEGERFDDVEVSGNLSGSEKRAAEAPRAQAGPVDMDQKLVRNAYLSLEVDDEEDFEPAIRKMTELARNMDGYVASESKTSILFKIPTTRLDEALAAIKKLGKVTHSDVTVQDVTAQYVDLQIRIDNLKRLRTRLQELLLAGQNVQEVLEVEKELARVTRELEQLEGQMRLLQNQVGYATVSVSLEESVTPGPIGWVFYGTYKAVKWLFVWD